MPLNGVLYYLKTIPDQMLISCYAYVLWYSLVGWTILVSHPESAWALSSLRSDYPANFPYPYYFSLSYCYFLESLHIQSTSFAWISIHRILSNTKFFFKFIHGKLVCSNSRVHPHEMSAVFRSLDGFLLFNSDKAAFSWPWHITYIIIHGGLNLTLLSPENRPQFQSLISFLW